MQKVQVTFFKRNTTELDEGREVKIEGKEIEIDTMDQVLSILVKRTATSSIKPFQTIIPMVDIKDVVVENATV